MVWEAALAQPLPRLLAPLFSELPGPPAHTANPSFMLFTYQPMQTDPLSSLDHLQTQQTQASCFSYINQCTQHHLFGKQKTMRQLVYFIFLLVSAWRSANNEASAGIVAVVDGDLRGLPVHTWQVLDHCMSMQSTSALSQKVPRILAKQKRIGRLFILARLLASCTEVHASVRPLPTLQARLRSRLSHFSHSQDVGPFT